VARIGFDGLMISPDGTGHARSELHAVEALAARGEHELVVFARGPVPVEGVEVVRVGDRLTIDWELRGLPRAACGHRLDAFVSLSERLPLAGGPPVVVWLFESPLHRIRSNRRTGAPLRHRSSDLFTLALWRRSLRRAAHVAFGSQATRDEVLGELPLVSTSVVHPGVPPGFAPGPTAAPTAGEPYVLPYVLHLGSSDPRDDTQSAVEACRRAGVRLLVAGNASRVASGPGVETLGRVSDDELVSLYRGAAAFLHPALYEGFGYAVLEAMACGAPVVATNATSLPEVVGEAGILCDPGAPDQLARALRRVLDEPGLAATLRARGLERAAGFTWERTGEGLSRAIAAAIGGSAAPSAGTSSRPGASAAAGAASGSPR
jgi:glycosyltransferase involved in cell wall biosynthesis